MAFQSFGAQVLNHRTRCEAAGAFEATRRAQQVRWMWDLIQERVAERVRTDPAIKAVCRRGGRGRGWHARATLAATEIAGLLGL